MASAPGPVLVSSSYTFEDVHGGLKQAMKYGSFDDHWSYWDKICSYEQQGRMQTLHEVIPATSPRSLYFDIDGKPEYRHLHDEIISYLRHYVRWVFSAEKLGWEDNDPEPVVLASENPLKYSCHVVFPQIQFTDHAEQSAYMKVLLTALPQLEVELEGGIRVPILEHVVDSVPYNQFQNFRGPYACKLKDGTLRWETQLKPESGYFDDSQLSSFASHVDRDQAKRLPSVDELLEFNPELRHFCEQHANRVIASGSGTCSMQDLSLYETAFQSRGGGIIDFAGLPELDIFEEALKWLHPQRTTQWWSWFRICGVTVTMLEKYGEDPQARSRIWQAHHAWSSQYPYFTVEENVEMVEKSRGKRVSGLPLLMRLVRFDNPDMNVRTNYKKVNLGGLVNAGAGQHLDSESFPGTE